MTKFIKIKFIYGLTFWPTKRSRKLRVTEVESSIRVPILELEEAEFPKAFAYPVKNWRTNELETVTIRSYQGRLYSISERVKDVSPTDSTFGRSIFNTYSDYCDYYERGQFQEGVSIAESDNKNEMIARVLNNYGDYFKHYVIFEGQIWEQVEEPRYVVEIPDFGFTPSIRIETKYSYTGVVAPFNANQLDLAIQYTKKKAKELSGDDYLKIDIDSLDKYRAYQITVYNQNFVTDFVPKIIMQSADEIEFGLAMFNKAHLKMGEYSYRDSFKSFTKAYKASLFIQNGQLTPIGEVLFEEKEWQLVKRDGLYIAEVKYDYFD